MAENTQRTARIPIIPDSLENQGRHKDKEIVMDFATNDIYIRRGDQYINITGLIRESILSITDGSTVIHIVDEATLPAVKDRKENNWYFVVTESEDYNTGDNTTGQAYIYYGVLSEEYYTDKSYLLIAQNMIINPATVRVYVPDEYKAVFYVPIDYDPTFIDYNTGLAIPFTIQDRVYILTPTNETRPYDVYISDEGGLGDIRIQVNYESTYYFEIDIKSNFPGIDGLYFDVTELRVEQGQPIGKLKEPEWTNGKYIFKGWSSKISIFEQIDPVTFVPKEDMEIYAFFEYDTDATKLQYRCVYQSTTGKTIRTFYSVAPPNTIIKPKEFDGYTAQSYEETPLTKNNQTYQFTYTPIRYNIHYELNGGTIVGQRETYTIEDSYVPPAVKKHLNTFMGWTPREIKEGTFGEFTFTANFLPNGVMPDGARLRELIDSLYPDLAAYAVGVAESLTAPTIIDDAIDISTNDVPIYIWYSGKTDELTFYSEYDISCSTNMIGVFEGFDKLEDITPLGKWDIDPTTDISRLFYGCTSLADVTPIAGWNMTGHMTNTFYGTAAKSASRLPSWYSE